MCGIAGFYFFTPNEHVEQERLINALLFGIDSRGGDACGFSAFDDDGLIMIEKAACDAKEFMKGRRDLPRAARYVMAHTRYATQGHQGFMRNNHPVVNNGVHVTHNGHIMNDWDVFQQVGWDKRLAEVDTEAIPAIVATEGWENWQKALEELEGGMAIAMAHEEFPGELILAKGEMSPLHYYATPKILMWASTIGCLQAAWKATIGKPPMVSNIKELKRGEALVVTPAGIENKTFECKPSWRSKYGKWVSWDDGWEGAGSTTGAAEWDNAEWYKDADGKWHKTGWHKTENGVWVQDDKYGAAQSDVQKALTRGKVDSGGPSAAAVALVEGAEVVQDEINQLRKRADEILHLDVEWWKDQELLDEFNQTWDRIRLLRGELEDAAWEAINRAIDEDDDEALGIQIECPSCMQMWPLADMDHIRGMDELYCQDCTDAWDEINDEAGKG